MARINVVYNDTTKLVTSLSPGVNAHTGHSNARLQPSLVEEGARPGGCYYHGTTAGVKIAPPAVTDDLRNALWQRTTTAYEEAQRVFSESVVWRAEGLLSGHSESRSDDSVEATARWLFHQKALVDRAIKGSVWSTFVVSDLERVVKQFTDVICPNIRVWYSVMVSDGTKRGQWKVVSSVNNATIYSDAYTSAGANRDLDGSFLPLAGIMLPGAAYDPHDPGKDASKAVL